MKSRFARIGLSLAAAVLVFSLAACTSGASSQAQSSGAESSSSGSSASSEASSGYSSLPEGVDAGNVMTIKLDYSAGTGFEWSYVAEPEGLVEFVDRTTVGLSDEKDTTGGPLQDQFTFRAKEPGELTLTFNLAREWETDEDPAQTQVYSLVINDDLDFIVNPYDSKFDHQPVWSTED